MPQSNNTAAPADQPPTRLERVRQILRDAAGESTSDYDGVGALWALPLEQLLEVEIHGVRLIAPEQPAEEGRTSSCCGGGAARGAAAAAEKPDKPRARPSRGAASALIRGLRGQSPFDGSRFPQLPWGGSAVAEDDIQFISDWIDDGCPAGGHELASLPIVVATADSALVDPHDLRAPEQIAHAFAPYEGSTNEYRYEQGEVRQRLNIDCMSADQLEQLRSAFRELFALNKWPEDRRSYNNIALIHQNHCQHGWERFLPWHRIYLYEFEQALQDQAPGVTLPYWDWTMPQYRPECPDKGWRIPRALQAYITDASIASLVRAGIIDQGDGTKLHGIVGQTYSSQQRFFDAVKGALGRPAFTTEKERRAFLDALLDANALWYPLRYPAEYHDGKGNPQTINQRVNYHYPGPDDMAQIMALRSFRDFGGGSLYNDSFGFLDQNPHNTMHLWTGGQNPDYQAPKATAPKPGAARDMGLERNRGVLVAGRRFHTRDDMYGQPMFGDMFSNLTASYDPVFWPIHTNIDRLWWEWQQMHSTSLPVDTGAVLTPWSYTVADSLDMSRFGYEYVRSAAMIPVGTGVPVGRFVSKPIEVSGAVGAFRKAEVRLHRVPQLPRSCFIRVFLNEPGANAQTGLDSPGYAGYMAIFGHGPCYGGPGHCAVPERRSRPYDLRPRSHNTPRNHRVDVTKKARELLEQGASALQITLVVIGADYCEDSDLLRLDGVSLNFLD